MTAQEAGLCKTAMDDNVDQLIFCAYLAGVSTATLLEGVEQVRAVALQRLTECEPKTSIRALDNDPAMVEPEAAQEGDCNAFEFVMHESHHSVTTHPTITLTLQGCLPDVHTFMGLMARAVKETPPRQPMLDLLRGTKGHPLHILCQIAESSDEQPTEEPHFDVMAPKAKTQVH